MSIDDELILSKWLQISRCGCLVKEQLWFDNQQKVIEQERHHVLGSTNLRVIKMTQSFDVFLACIDAKDHRDSLSYNILKSFYKGTLEKRCLL